MANSGYDSYIVSDYGRRVTFDVAGDELQLRGTPYFYFWHRRGNSAEFQANGETVVAKQDFDLLGFFYAAGFGPSQQLAFVTQLA